MDEPEWGADVCGLVFGTNDESAAVAGVATFLEARLGPTSDVRLIASNMVAAFSAQVDGHGRVAVRVHQPGADIEAMMRAAAVQRAVSRVGIPAPQPILGPEPLGNGSAVVEQFMSAGAENGWGAEIAGPMGNGLARIAAACRDLDFEFPTGTLRTDDYRLVSHTSLFDFEATTDGAEWIEHFGRRAHERLWDMDADDPIVAHRDWRLGNAEVAGGAIRAIYDWSSLERWPQAEAVGTAAISFGAWWDRDGRKAGMPAEAAMFLRAYEHAAGKAFTTQQRRIAGAAAVMHLAFVARCEHSLGWEDGPFLSRHALREYGDTLLTLGIGS